MQMQRCDASLKNSYFPRQIKVGRNVVIHWHLSNKILVILSGLELTNYACQNSKQEAV